mgnify:CR=1 FL=1
MFLIQVELSIGSVSSPLQRAVTIAVRTSRA